MALCPEEVLVLCGHLPEAAAAAPWRPGPSRPSCQSAAGRIHVHFEQYEIVVVALSCEVRLRELHEACSMHYSTSFGFRVFVSQSLTGTVGHKATRYIIECCNGIVSIVIAIQKQLNQYSFNSVLKQFVRANYNTELVDAGGRYE